MSDHEKCPNPWCESTDLTVETDFFDDSPLEYTVVCNGCHLIGPDAPTEDEAWRLWDGRKAAAPQSDGAEK